MAKKAPSATPSIPSLTFRDLVLGADAETIRQALEARVRIDELIAERQAAYERIAALETQIEDVIGEPGVFPFPSPPLPVAGIDPKADTLTRIGGAAAAKKSVGRARSESALDKLEDPENDDNGSAIKRPFSTAESDDESEDDPESENDPSAAADNDDERDDSTH